MQPILAESAPHRGRAVAFAVALAAVASLAFAAMPPSHSRYRDHHRLQRIGKCAYSHYSYVYVTR
jgi:hypothetical protein